MAKRKKKLYRLVDDNFGDDGGQPISLEEFRKAARELNWPRLRLVEDSDGVLWARVIYDEARYCIYEGAPGFDRLTWYKRGANWRAVLRPCTEEELREKTPVVNLTLHQQGERECLLLREAGYDFATGPRGVEVGPGQEGLEEAAQKLWATLLQASLSGAAVLIGGHTGAIAAALGMLPRSLWPELICFETRRIRDESDRFIFAPTGIQKISTEGRGYLRRRLRALLRRVKKLSRPQEGVDFASLDAALQGRRSRTLKQDLDLLLRAGLIWRTGAAWEAGTSLGLTEAGKNVLRKELT